MKKKSSWPKSEAYVSRFRVPDLIPPQTEIHELKAIFIGESPHRDEVLSEDPGERSPFRGVAGREWWTELSRFMKKPSSMRPVPPRNELLLTFRPAGPLEKILPTKLIAAKPDGSSNV